VSIPLRLARKSHALTCDKSKALDTELLDGLRKIGFKLDFGENNTGWQFKYLTRGGGYYFNVGCSDLLIRREIALKQFADIDTFTAEGARMKGGEIIPADLIVLATGYRPQEELVQKLFGVETAKRVGTIWGFGDTEELRAMYVRTGQPGLWFIAGGLAQCRIGSKQLALQIKAIEEGILPRLHAPTFEAAVA
jgi:putative flavoprotein involved in K+ transport